MDIVEEYWKKVDLLLAEQKHSLIWLCDTAEIDYQKVRTWRYKNTIPNPEALVAISDTLKVSIDFLLRNAFTQPSDFTDREFAIISILRKDERFNKIVSRCLQDERFLDSLGYLCT